VVKNRDTDSLAGLNRVDLAVGELAGADTLVWGAVLLETAVLCLECNVSERSSSGSEAWCSRAGNVPVGL